MKSTGITRKVDELGRIVLPVELRKSLNLEIRDTLEIFTEEDKIILKKYNPGCTFCTSTVGVVEFAGKRVCKDCLDCLKELA